MDSNLATAFSTVRQQSVQFCEPLAVEDYGLQAMADTSPPKWHLAHTTWFFETFLLKPFVSGYQPFHPQYEVLFNSYYNGIGEQYPRPKRGLLSRPTVAEVLAYRQHVDRAMEQLLAKGDEAEVVQRTVLGLHHEQQHQELFFTDLKYSFAQNPLFPAYSDDTPSAPEQAVTGPLRWREFDGGLHTIGHQADGLHYRDFAFDNEGPEHQQYLYPFAIADRPVNNAEVLAFIDDGGYERPELWLADGWATVQQQQWRHPLYWQRNGEHWQQYSLYGLQALDPAAPACHLSGYEADAIARWLDARLPTEAEWETAARLSGQDPADGQFVNDALQPLPPKASQGFQPLFGGIWQWTASAYAPYPGFQSAAGAIGEYNGKFMSNQWVLRGGSCLSTREHLRASYRNFFYPPDRWQMTGLRLAKDLR